MRQTRQSCKSGKSGPLLRRLKSTAGSPPSALLLSESVEMETTRVTASEFQRDFGVLSDKAKDEPVVITQHGRDTLVVMSAEEWMRLRRRDRLVGLTADLPDEWVEAVQNAAVSSDFAYLDAELT